MRTWGGRVANFRKQHQNGQLENFIQKTQTGNPHNTLAFVLSAQASQVLKDPSLLDLFTQQQAALEPVEQLLDLLRINLGKHEAPEKRNSISPTPGYGRINSSCGAIDFEVLSPTLDSAVANRRDVADALRSLRLPSRSS